MNLDFSLLYLFYFMFHLHIQTEKGNNVDTGWVIPEVRSV